MSERSRPANDVDRIAVVVLAGIGGVAGSFAVAGATPAFVAGPIAGALARWLPAPVITFAIVVLGDLGAQLNVVTAIALAVGMFAVLTLVGEAVGRGFESEALGSAVAGVAAGGAAYGLTGALPASVAAGLALALVHAIASLGESDVLAPSLSPARRRVLAGAVGAAAFAVGGYVFGRRQPDTGTGPTEVEFDLEEPVRADIDTNLDLAAGRSLAVDGLEPLVSTEFYTVDINATDPTVDADTWTLDVTGAVERPLTYVYADIESREMRNQFISLRCVGESLNGRKMDNALWTGIPIMDLVEPAGVASDCCVMLRAADGFFEEFPLSALQDGFLAIGMNGNALPRAHGFPARALIPGHWGEINVKWLTEIEILEREEDGYWEQRGWHGTGPVNTVAKLHVDNRLDDGRIEVAGHAYAGTRGVDRVEVSTDGGSTWADATLSDPLPGTDVWRQWVYRYVPPSTPHEVVVRATDGTGALQPETPASAFPSGPSGWVSRTIRP